VPVVVGGDQVRPGRWYAQIAQALDLGPMEPVRVEPIENGHDPHDLIAQILPILTTDYFEFGTSKNNLDQEGGAVEMGDAVLGLAIDERSKDGRSTPNWLVIRTCYDPQINGDLYHQKGNTKQRLQIMYAVYYYKGYGYWTSVMSALATWG